MYKKILVPLDGSELAEAVVPHVSELARRINAEVYLLRVMTQTTYEPTYVTATATLPQRGENVGARAHAEGYLQRIAFDHFPSNLRVSYEVTGGPVADTILDYAAGIQADLIAMSTHGRSGIARMVIGSIADEIVRRSHLPVLLVRPEESK
jgi:nucleotide-binding universal stress UspA family protein